MQAVACMSVLLVAAASYQTVQGLCMATLRIIDLRRFWFVIHHASHTACKAEMRFSFSVCSVRADRALYTARCSQEMVVR
jgi:hypothetical protein